MDIQIQVSLIERSIRLVGGILAYNSLVVSFFGIWRGTRRPSGMTSGWVAGWLRSAAFYLFATLVFLGFSIIFWKAIPFELPREFYLTLLIIGSLFYFPGIAFLLWARLTLGKMYFVSTSFGAQLFTDHKLVTGGPFAIIRHPMYLGMITAGLGSLLLYLTWTTLAKAIFAPFVLRRATREERALSAEFGKDWMEYCQRVPVFLPRLKRR